MSAEPKESAEPRTEAGKQAETTLPHFDTCAGMRGPNPCDCGVVTTILAIEDQAATEARRELLAKVEAIPTFDDPESIDAAWADVVAVMPKGWVFHGVYLDDNSGTGGDWGPGWTAQMSWPGHCQYDDCDHDDAFRIGGGATPAAALRSLLNDFSWTVLPKTYTDRSYTRRPHE